MIVFVLYAHILYTLFLYSSYAILILYNSTRTLLR